MNMNKKEYIEPVMTPVLLKHRSHLMQTGSEAKYDLHSNLDDPDEEITIDQKGDTYGKWGR